uniref:Reverse transcriptase domain-containing protein n=1 Tax=Trichobilharzia regenti TaxID=157069 RepID=A0AA85J8Y4_TRIRE|nr:unnamed protein product [Trichobilharzia regenti]
MYNLPSFFCLISITVSKEDEVYEYALVRNATQTTCLFCELAISSSEVVTTSAVRRGCPLYPFLLNFVTDALMELNLSDFSDSEIDLSPVENNLVDFEYADDIVLPPR